MPSPATRLAFDADYETVAATMARRARLDAQIEQLAAGSQFTPVVRRLGCLRGISTLTGFALAVEIGDWHRFTGRTIATFVGLVPSEYSSGQSTVRGPITKTAQRDTSRLERALDRATRTTALAQRRRDAQQRLANFDS